MDAVPAGNDEVEQVFADRTEAIAELGRQAYELLLRYVPDAVVTTDRDQIGVGTAPGYKGLIFTLIPAKAHITLGIAGGAALPDPSGLMEGKGKVHRHIKLHSPADLANPALQTLLQTAITTHTA